MFCLPKTAWPPTWKARAGRQPDSRQANPGSPETPGVSREGFLAVKAEGGGDVKAFPGCLG